jgi:hypothetical protein
MSVVMVKGLSKRGHRLIKIFVADVLVSAEGASIGERCVHLDGAIEELDGSLVLLLQREAVADNTPRFRTHLVNLHHLLGESAELLVSLEVPQRRGQDLRAGHAEGLQPEHLSQSQLSRLHSTDMKNGKGDLTIDEMKIVESHLVII